MRTVFFETTSFTTTVVLDDGQFWMFAIYDKDELENLTADQEKALKTAIGAELKQRGGK